jgi:hypothetical protein
MDSPLWIPISGFEQGPWSQPHTHTHRERERRSLREIETGRQSGVPGLIWSGLVSFSVYRVDLATTTNRLVSPLSGRPGSTTGDTGEDGTETKGHGLGNQPVGRTAPRWHTLCDKRDGCVRLVSAAAVFVPIGAKRNLAPAGPACLRVQRSFVLAGVLGTPMHLELDCHSV